MKNLSYKSKTKLKQLITLAKQVDSTDEFIDKARKDADVPQQLADWFANRYGMGTMLSIEKASADFIEDVENGRFKIFLNPYLYRREEIRM